MTFYGKHGYSFVQQSGTFGQDISNDNHDTGLQAGWTYTSQLTVEAGMYVIHAHYSPAQGNGCLLYTSPSPRDRQKSRMPSSA